MSRFFRKLRLSSNASDQTGTPRNTGDTAETEQPFPCGLKLLYEGSDSIFDIVFIHGLMGDRERTWRAPGASLPWPQTLLPQDVPIGVRIFTFGYDAYLAAPGRMISTARIGDHAAALLKSLVAVAPARELNGHIKVRPIIFICHSLGGLVCKDALRYAGSITNDPAETAVFNRTRGIVFMGTPHRGADLARWSMNLAKIPAMVTNVNTRLLNVLQCDSEVLSRIHDEFMMIVSRRNSTQGYDSNPINIACIFEELPTRGGILIVPRASAILDGYPCVSIHADHSGMTKFSKQDDPGYRILLSKLRSVTRAPGDDLQMLSIFDNLHFKLRPDYPFSQRNAAVSTSRSSEKVATWNHAYETNTPYHANGATTSDYTRRAVIEHHRSDAFVGREEVLRTLQKKLFNLESTINEKSETSSMEKHQVEGSLPPVRSQQVRYHRRAALYGLGGIGKTQIAIEFAHASRAADSQLNVFWVNGSSREKFSQAYGVIARACDIYVDESVKKHTSAVLQAVKDWLEDAGFRWLMIVDNADDGGIFYNPATSDTTSDDNQPIHLGKYLPESSNGSILFTTRDKQAANWLLRNDGRGLISVGAMGECEYQKLFCNKMGDNAIQAAESKILVERLEGLPLALAQAAAYIKAHGISTMEYIDLISANETLLSLLDYNFIDEGRVNGVPNALTASWYTTFRQLEKDSPDAAAMMALMCCFDCEDIPRYLIEHYFSDQASPTWGLSRVYGTERRTFKVRMKPGDGRQRPRYRSGIGFKRERDTTVVPTGLGKLKSLSFITNGRSPNHFNVHRLVQKVVRRYLDVQERLSPWADKAANTLERYLEYPRGSTTDWANLLELGPHLLAMVELLDSLPDLHLQDLSKACLKEHLGTYLWHLGFTDRAIEAQEAALLLRENEDRALAIQEVEERLREEEDRRQEAERAAQGIHSVPFGPSEIPNENLGIKGKGILWCKVVLARYLDQHGRLSRAKELVEEALAAGMERHDDGLRVECQLILSSILATEGDTRGAARLAKKAVTKAEELFGLKNWWVRECVCDFADLLLEMGRVREALPLYEKALQAEESSLGQNLLRRAAVMYRLSYVYAVVERDTEAVTMLEKAFTVYETLGSPDKQLTKEWSDSLVRWKGLQAAKTPIREDGSDRTVRELVEAMKAWEQDNDSEISDNETEGEGQDGSPAAAEDLTWKKRVRVLQASAPLSELRQVAGTP